MNKRIKKKKTQPKVQKVDVGKVAACKSIQEADEYVVFAVNYSGKNYGINCKHNLPAEKFRDFITNAAPGFIPKQENSNQQ